MHFSVGQYKCPAFPCIMCLLLESFMQNTSYSTVKTPPSLKKTKLSSQKNKAHAKTLYWLLSITQTWKQIEAATFTQMCLSTQWFPNKISCVAYAAKTIATRLADGMLWIGCWHKTQTYHSVLSWHQNLFPCYFSHLVIFTHSKKNSLDTPSGFRTEKLTCNIRLPCHLSKK